MENRNISKESGSSILSTSHVKCFALFWAECVHRFPPFEPSFSQDITPGRWTLDAMPRCRTARGSAGIQGGGPTTAASIEGRDEIADPQGDQRTTTQASFTITNHHSPRF